MKADVKTLRTLTVDNVRYLIPRYQRPYVWNQDDHWEPLWNDVLDVIDRQRQGRGGDHFLGAIVVKHETTPPGEPTRYEVIDGQQRMTTIQLLLMAAVNVARTHEINRTARLLEKMVLNDPDIAEGELLYKVWPTETDRAAFMIVAKPGGPDPHAEDDPSNMIQEAFAFFHHKISEFALADATDGETVEDRLEEFRLAFSESFKFVAITLEGEDEAQVIFETLNARGTPLLAMDLVKNATFRIAEQQAAPVAELHDGIWEPEFGRAYWRAEVRQGRLTRPRAEIFLMHWMTMKLGSSGRISETIRADRVFKTFQTEFLGNDGQADPLIRELARDAATMRSLEDFLPGTREGRFFRTMDYMEQTTFMPVVLWLYTQDIAPESRHGCLAKIESFLVRRALMGYFTKAYNRLALRLLSRLKPEERPVAEQVGSFLADSGEPSATWPDDTTLRERLTERPIYGWVSRRRVAGILSEIELFYRGSAKSEDVALLDQSLSIEHAMPQTWENHWPLDSPAQEDIDRRDGTVNLLGNLTIITGSLNSSLSNQSWPEKQVRYREHSLLLLNSRLAQHGNWNEDTIRSRGEELTDRIIELWPGPESA